MSNVTFHFKQGASGDDHSVSNDLKLNPAWVVTHSLQDVADTHPCYSVTAGRPACLLELEGNLNAPESDKACVEVGGLAGCPPERLACSESPVYTRMVLLVHSCGVC